MSAAPAIDTAARRCAAVLAAGGLLLPLAACTSGGGDSPRGDSGAARDIRVASRDDIEDGGTLRWAIEEMPTTLNVFQPDATPAGSRVAGAVLPALFTLDSQGRPQPNPDYLVSAEVTQTEPRQTVVYTLAPEAEWSGGRAISVADFRAQWEALNGENSAYWTARNAGYDRIAEVEKGENARQVKVTFDKPYADWEALFTPLYPKSVMGTPEAFNEKARTRLPASGGPFRVEKFDAKKDDAVTLVRNDAWWGDTAKLDRIELTVVPRGERRKALEAGKVDLADVTPKLATRIDGVHSTDAKPGEKAQQKARQKPQTKAQRKAAEKRNGALGTYDVRRALAPAYTQLALNGASGPLADERVRRALARVLDREKLAQQALAGLGLPAQPLGSHLRMRDQYGYHDNSAALGGRDVESAQALLADAGWMNGGPVTGEDQDAPIDAKEAKEAKGKKDGKNKDAENNDAEKEDEATDDRPPARSAAPGGTGLLVSAAEAARITSVPLSVAPYTAAQRAGVLAQAADAQGRAAVQRGDDEHKKNGEPADKAKRAAERARQRADEMKMLDTGQAAAVRTKGGRPLALRFLVPAGPGTGPAQETAERIADQLNEVGIRTRIERIKDESWFRDHIASGDFDLALYSWPATAFPATDAGPIFAKPVPAANGSLTVQQNYTRVGTDRIDQLFAAAVGELDTEKREELLRRADERIWAAAGSVPLYQRPQLVAVRTDLANAGAFGFQTPRYQDIGWVR